MTPGEDEESDPEVRATGEEKKEHESEFYGATKAEDRMDMSS